jgi:hypothetical protein
MSLIRKKELHLISAEVLADQITSNFGKRVAVIAGVVEEVPRSGGMFNLDSRDPEKFTVFMPGNSIPVDRELTTDWAIKDLGVRSQVRKPGEVFQFVDGQGQTVKGHLLSNGDFFERGF